MRNKIILFISLCSIFSCNISEEIEQHIEGYILFPENNAKFIENHLINFIAEGNVDNFVWKDQDGEILSNDKTFVIEASDRLKTVSLYYNEILLDEINLNIAINPDIETITMTDQEIVIDTSIFNKGHFISFGPELVEFNLTSYISNSKGRDLKLNSIELLKDPILSFNRNANILPSFTFRSLLKDEQSYYVGDSKNFYIADINGSNSGEAYDKTFTLIFSDEKVNYWWDEDNIQDSSVVDGIINSLSSVYYDKVVKLWGNFNHISTDNKINILFSRNLNDSDMAIGFFNPNDFFANVSDVNSESYNPYSNESEVLFLGVPEDDRFAFSEESLLATAVHELCHLIVFHRKTYSEYVKGNENPPVMDNYLNEGLAHLTESLCGLGVSGGNIAFYESFLRDPSTISLVEDNIYGQPDSIGKRGAVSGFLSWLFWYKGGFTFDQNLIVDNGGISFLNDLLLNQSDSWISIGEAFGKSTNTIFEEWVNDLIIEDLCSGLYDSITGEPLFLDPWLGSFSIDEDLSSDLYGLDFSFFTTEQKQILSYSVYPWKVEDSISDLFISDIKGNSFVKLLLYE